MADYVLPDVVEKRVRYFDGQFLQDQDFIDEQDYQLDREHRHSRLLHGAGIVDGLLVSSSAPNQVTVFPGTAIDSDGNQLVLAQATPVDLPAADFNDKAGVQLYLSYLVSAEDQQTVGGSSDFTRWLERPQLTALGPGNQYSGTASPVLLASLALDNAGRVTVDGSVRVFSGLLLPGPRADPVSLRVTSGGSVHLTDGLIVDGHVGIAQPSPAYDLEVGNYDPQDRFMALKVQGGNQHVSGIKFWTWQDNYGYSLQYDERMASSNGLHVKTHNIDPNGVTRMFIDWFTGNLGVGTTTPGARLEVAGGGGTSVDLLVNGRLRSGNNDGGLWVMEDRFIGGFGSGNVGFWNGGQWRLTVQPSGHVGINQTNPVNNDLEIGNYDGLDRFMALKVAGGNQHVSGIKFWTWQENYGYSLQYDERMASPNGLHIKTHNIDPNGVTRMFIDWFTGNLGVGTTTPGARLEVAGGGGDSVDLLVNGRLRSNNNDGGLWVMADRFVGGTGPANIGFWAGGEWRLIVQQNGNTGIGAGQPTATLHVSTPSSGSPFTVLQVDAQSFQTGANALASYFLNVRDVGAGAGGDHYLCVRGDGRVGLGTGSPGAKLEVVGGGGTSVDMVVNGRLQSNNNDGGLWVMSDRFVGGFGAGNIGFWNNGQWRLTVQTNGTVGIGTTDTGGAALHVAGTTWSDGPVYAGGGLVLQTGPNQWSSIGSSSTTFDPRQWLMVGAAVRAPSDLRLKTDLRPVGNALDLVRQLQAVRYQWGEEGLRYLTAGVEDSVSAGPAATEEQHQQVRQQRLDEVTAALAGDLIGLVAQDVEAVLPELVLQDAEGYKHIRYQHLTAVLAEAIKELSAEVAALRSTGA